MPVEADPAGWVWMQAVSGGTIDPASFKAGLRHLAGGVCIVTSLTSAGLRAGMIR